MVVQLKMMRLSEQKVPEGVELRGELLPEFGRVLTPEALGFVTKLERTFRERRLSLLERRAARQSDIDAGARPDFSLATQHIRDGKWAVAPIPDDLLDRRVEITGPTDRKMIINALNSGANVFMADFEDSNVPTWDNMVQGQINLCDAVEGTIRYTSPEGKEYELKKSSTTLMVRPRGLHLDERRVLVDGKPVSASLFDFGVYFYHNAWKLINRRSGPYFYLPKLESHLEARLWNDIFVKAQEELGIPVGTIRATVLIETIYAAFEMEEILYELKDHSSGLNCGRWDYIFSCVKAFRNHPEFLFPDRSLLTMNAHFLRSYSRLLIQTCHKRGIHAIGGMAAYIPVKTDSRANERALKSVRIDKEREVMEGHDGSWVAHPGLIPIVRKVFDDRMRGPQQIHVKRNDVLVTSKDLLGIPQGDISSNGFSNNVSVGLQYLESWLGGTGCVAINNLMEDTATAEICRSQLWHWLHHPAASLAGDGKITAHMYHSYVQDELARLKHAMGTREFEKRRFGQAAKLLDAMVLKDQIDDFLTLRTSDFLD